MRFIKQLFFLVLCCILLTPFSFAQEIDALQKEIQEKSQQVEELTKQLYVYDQNVKEKQEEQRTLEHEIAVIDLAVEKIETEIERSTIEVEVAQIEIEVLQKKIQDADQEMQEQKDALRSLIRELYVKDQRTPLEVTLSSPTFSDFFTSLEHNQTLQRSVDERLGRIQTISNQLKEHRSALKEKKAELSQQLISLEAEQQHLQGQQQYKEILLAETQESEDQFQEFVDQARAEQRTLESELSTMEQAAREKIEAIREEALHKLEDADQSNDTLTPEEEEAINGKTDFVWPVDSRVITCEFGCISDYHSEDEPHTGLDIATPMGSPVYAAASGYVSRVVFDPHSSSLGFVMINHLHGGFSSFYGHLSCVNVVFDQYVTQGQQIGCSGGMPGTPGAGYSSGPHLHFEIRMNGIITDPHPYLPQ